MNTLKLAVRRLDKLTQETLERNDLYVEERADGQYDLYHEYGNSRTGLELLILALAVEEAETAGVSFYRDKSGPYSDGTDWYARSGGHPKRVDMGSWLTAENIQTALCFFRGEVKLGPAQWFGSEDTRPVDVTKRG